MKKITVKQLRDMLAAFPDETTVVFSQYNGCESPLSCVSSLSFHSKGTLIPDGVDNSIEAGWIYGKGARLIEDVLEIKSES